MKLKNKIKTNICSKNLKVTGKRVSKSVTERNRFVEHLNWFMFEDLMEKRGKPPRVIALMWHGARAGKLPGWEPSQADDEDCVCRRTPKMIGERDVEENVRQKAVVPNISRPAAPANHTARKLSRRAKATPPPSLRPPTNRTRKHVR